MTLSVRKVLSQNDLGLTGSHQAGFLIPKSLIEQGVFPKLTTVEPNPRVRLRFLDEKTQEVWYFTYIFYNNKFFRGSRSEYRLTGLASFLRANSLKPGDNIVFTLEGQYDYRIVIQKQTRESSFLSKDSWFAIYGGNS